MKYLISFYFALTLTGHSKAYSFDVPMNILCNKPLYSINACQQSASMVNPPDVTISFSNPMIVGQQGTMTFTLTNDAGNPAQYSIGYTYTLPTGLNFPVGATVSNGCGSGTGTISGNTITFANGTMASGMATCTLTVAVTATSEGTVNPTRGSFGSLLNVTVGANNGAGVNPMNIVVNAPSCAANAGVLSY
jgi:hypothetical protein